MAVSLSHFFDFGEIPEKFYPSIINEFKEYGSTDFVLTDTMLKNFLSEPWACTRMKR